jgi:hypothetical protein
MSELEAYLYVFAAAFLFGLYAGMMIGKWVWEERRN